jgi:dihydroorotase
VGLIAADADIVVRAASIFDPERDDEFIGDIAIQNGAISAISSANTLTGARVIDGSGALLTPGLVDIHTHVFAGQDLGVPADDIGLPNGVTTVVDAGSAGAHLYKAFETISIHASQTRVRCLLNVSTIGTTSIMLAGELATLAYVDVASAVDCIRRHRDTIVGVKIRASANVAPTAGDEIFKRAQRIAREVGLPLMVHVGPAPPTLEDVFSRLDPGDIVTHCFSGLAEPTMANERTLDVAREARSRGVLFDIGHGMAGFDSEVARTAIQGGFVPDSISTDLHAYSRPTVAGMPEVMSKLWALGMTRRDVLLAATLNPARALNLAAAGIGTLRIGAAADLALWSVVTNPVRFADTRGHEFAGDVTLRPIWTMRSGALAPGARRPNGPDFK